jgi:hypothetical protein
MDNDRMSVFFRRPRIASDASAPNANLPKNQFHRDMAERDLVAPACRERGVRAVSRAMGSMTLA